VYRVLERAAATSQGHRAVTLLRIKAQREGGTAIQVRVT
jgi:hypothetical protein